MYQKISKIFMIYFLTFSLITPLSPVGASGLSGIFGGGDGSGESGALGSILDYGTAITSGIALLSCKHAESGSQVPTMRTSSFVLYSGANIVGLIAEESYDADYDDAMKAAEDAVTDAKDTTKSSSVQKAAQVEHATMIKKANELAKKKAATSKTKSYAIMAAAAVAGIEWFAMNGYKEGFEATIKSTCKSGAKAAGDMKALYARDEYGNDECEPLGVSCYCFNHDESGASAGTDDKDLKKKVEEAELKKKAAGLGINTKSSDKVYGYNYDPREPYGECGHVKFEDCIKYVQETLFSHTEAGTAAATELDKQRAAEIKEYSEIYDVDEWNCCNEGSSGGGSFKKVTLMDTCWYCSEIEAFSNKDSSTNKVTTKKVEEVKKKDSGHGCSQCKWTPSTGLAGYTLVDSVKADCISSQTAGGNSTGAAAYCQKKEEAWCQKTCKQTVDNLIEKVNNQSTELCGKRQGEMNAFRIDRDASFTSAAAAYQTGTEGLCPGEKKAMIMCTSGETVDIKKAYIGCTNAHDSLPQASWPDSSQAKINSDECEKAPGTVKYLAIEESEKTTAKAAAAKKTGTNEAAGQVESGRTLLSTSGQGDLEATGLAKVLGSNELISSLVQGGMHKDPQTRFITYALMGAMAFANAKAKEADAEAFDEDASDAGGGGGGGDDGGGEDADDDLDDDEGGVTKLDEAGQNAARANNSAQASNCVTDGSSVANPVVVDKSCSCLETNTCSEVGVTGSGIDRLGHGLGIPTGAITATAKANEELAKAHATGAPASKIQGLQNTIAKNAKAIKKLNENLLNKMNQARAARGQKPIDLNKLGRRFAGSLKNAARKDLASGGFKMLGTGGGKGSLFKKDKKGKDGRTFYTKRKSRRKSSKRKSRYKFDKNSKGKLNASKELAKYKVKVSDINNDSGANIFKAITNRYRQSAYRVLFKKKKKEVVTP